MKKGIKTTIVAFIALLLGVTVFVLWFLKKLDNTQLALGLSSVATFGTTVGLFFAKDADKSHTQNKSLTGGHPDSEKEEK